VKGDADDVEIQFLRGGEEARYGLEGRAELDAERAERLAVVGENADDTARTGVNARDFVQLIGVVEGHEIDTALGCVADERWGFAGIRKDDLGRRDAANIENHANFIVGCTIEACAERRKETNNIWVGIALDGIEWLHIGKASPPSHVLLVNFAQVRHKKRLLSVWNVVCRKLGSAKNAFAKKLRGMTSEEWRKGWEDRNALRRDDGRVGRDTEYVLLCLHMSMSDSIRVWVRHIMGEVEGAWREGFET
jgi:hypothetical protein